MGLKFKFVSSDLGNLNILSYTCAIEDGEAVVLTGGHDLASKTKVTKYTAKGQATSLPSLTIGRYGHACGKVVKKDGGTVSRRSGSG